jgi:hypothetical protein
MSIKLLKQLKLPEEKGIIFTRPTYSDWIHLMHSNSKAVRKFDTQQNRKELVKLAKKYTLKLDAKKPDQESFEKVIVTGHQATWHHCGILAKNALTCRFATETHGVGIHLVLDHDDCDTEFLLPQKKHGLFGFKKIKLETENQNTALEARPAPPTEKIKLMLNQIAKDKQDRLCISIWTEFLNKRLRTLYTFKNIAELITYLQAQIYAVLGVDLLYLPVSHLSQSTCFLRFVLSIMNDAPNFARIYNQALKHSNNKSFRDLRELIINQDKKRVELPFWLISQRGNRSTLFIKSIRNQNFIFGTQTRILGRINPTQELQIPKQFDETLKKYGYCLRPKAIPLTLFVRLYLADWFVHGLGGAKYEAITNSIIEKYYHLKKLHFGIATATLTMPLTDCKTTGYKATAELKQKLRALRFNPERFIKKSVSRKNIILALIKRKKELIESSQKPTLTGQERKMSWQKISELNRKMLEYASVSIKQIEKKIQTAKRYELHKQAINNRDLFFGLFSEKTLQDFIK